MRRFVLLAAALGIAAAADAQSAGHGITIVVPEVEELAVAPDPVRLAFAPPAPGAPFEDAVGASTYRVTVNTAGNKITGALDGPFAEGVRLSVRLEAPPGAASLGEVELGTAARDLVADVSAVGAVGLGMEYRASAEVTAAPNGPGETRTVIYTVTDQ